MKKTSGANFSIKNNKTTTKQKANVVVEKKQVVQQQKKDVVIEEKQAVKQQDNGGVEEKQVVRQLLGNHVNIREQITNPLMEKIIANKSVVSRAEVIEASKGISAALCNAYQSRQSIIKNMNSIYDKINAGNCKNRDDVIKFYGDLYNLAQGVFGLSDYADGRWCTHETVHANLRFIYLCDSLVSSIDENLEKILA